MARSNDSSTWGTFEEAIKTIASHEADELGIGFMLGDGWCGIDLDHVAPEGEVLGQAQEIINMTAGGGYMERSPGGDGIHIIFNCDKPAGYTSVRKLDIGSAEFYGKGRFFTVTGEKLDENRSVCEGGGGLYRVAESFFTKGPVPQNKPVVATKLPLNASQAEIYAQTIIDSESFGEGSRNSSMFRIAGHLWKKCQDESEVKRLCLRVNDAVFSPPLSEHEVMRCAYNGITKGTPRNDNYNAAEVYTEDQIEFTFDKDAFIKHCKALAKEQVPISEFESLGGLIGEYVRNYKDLSPEYLPELGVASALNLMSTLIGGSVECEGCVPNLFTVGLAPSGAGKDYCRRLTSATLEQSGMGNRNGPTGLSSGEGMVSRLADQNITLFQLDEAGELLAESGNAKNAVAARIGKFLKEAYSTSGSVWRPNCKADSKSNITIQYPYPVVYFTTTHERFWQSFSEESVEDGFLGRLLVFEQAGYTLPRRGTVYKPPVPSDKLIRLASAWADARGAGDLPPELFAGNRLHWTVGPNARKCLDDFFYEVDYNAWSPRKNNGDSALWKRTKDKIMKVATVLAASRQGPTEDGVIEEVDAVLAINLVKSLTYRVLRRVKDDLVSGEHDRAQKKIMTAIERLGGFREGVISRHVRGLDKRIRNLALEDLIQAGQLVRIMKSDGKVWLIKP